MVRLLSIASHLVSVVGSSWNFRVSVCEVNLVSDLLESFIWYCEEGVEVLVSRNVYLHFLHFVFNPLNSFDEGNLDQWVFHGNHAEVGVVSEHVLKVIVGQLDIFKALGLNGTDVKDVVDESSVLVPDVLVVLILNVFLNCVCNIQVSLGISHLCENERNNEVDHGR